MIIIKNRFFESKICSSKPNCKLHENIKNKVHVATNKVKMMSFD